MSDEEKEKKKEKREEKREAVILFADLMNSSELSNILSAEEYDEILKNFQEELGEVVKKKLKEKIKNKDFKVEAGVQGDEICVKLYNAKNRDDKELLQEDIETALQIAIEMKRKWITSNLNREKINDNKPLSDIGIGINSGTIVLGKHPRFNEELELENKNTPEGYAINLAKRIESHSRDLRFSYILVSKSIFDFVETDFQIAFIRRPEIGRFKGISQEIPVYEVIGIGHFDDRAFDVEDYFVDNIEIYENSVRDNPDMVWLLLDLGHHYFDREDYDKSIEKYQQALDVLPDFAPAYMYLGRCLFRKYQYEDARYYLERAVRLSPFSARANSFLAVCLRRLSYKYKEDDKEWKSLYKSALEHHEQAKRIAKIAKERLNREDSPAYRWALNGLARTIAEAEKEVRGHYTLDDAEKDAKEALTLVKAYNPDKEHLVIETLGYIYYKKYQEEVEECKKDGSKKVFQESFKNADENFTKAIKAVEIRHENVEIKMGNRNYYEKLSEVHFHLALLYKAREEYETAKRKHDTAQKYMEKTQKKTEDAITTATIGVNKEFAKDQYWYKTACQDETKEKEDKKQKG